MATLWKCVAEPSGNPSGRKHYTCVRRAAKTPLTGDKIDEPAACAVPFRPYCGGVVTRTQNVSEYMLALALCLVVLLTLIGNKSYLCPVCHLDLSTVLQWIMAS